MFWKKENDMATDKKRVTISLSDERYADFENWSKRLVSQNQLW